LGVEEQQTVVRIAGYEERVAQAAQCIGREVVRGEILRRKNPFGFIGIILVTFVFVGFGSRRRRSFVAFAAADDRQYAQRKEQVAQRQDGKGNFRFGSSIFHRCVPLNSVYSFKKRGAQR
jgi:hypothetical protein